MDATCTNDLALEELLLGMPAPAQQDHVERCAACQARLAEMRALGDHFRQYVLPATAEAVLDAAARPRAWSLARWLAPLPALAAAAAVILAVGPAGPPADYVGEKGSATMGLTVFLQEAGLARAASDGEAVPAAARVRFKVRPAHPCHLWVLSVDGTGLVSRLFPAAGEGGRAVEQTTVLPGGAALDDQAGPERFLAVCAPEPVEYARVEGAVRAATTGGPGAVRALGAVPGLPAGTLQSSVLLEKRR